MNKEKKKEVNLKTIWKMFRSEKGRRYSFIIFYLFFFGFLFIFINTNKIDNQNINEEVYSLPFKTINLEQNNYNFKYIIKTNLSELLYKGEKQSSTINIIDDTGEYLFTYRNGELTGDYKILYKELFDIFQIKKIIKEGKLVSETKLSETNEFIFNYKISNEKLDNILHNNISALDLNNEIEIKTNSNKEIKEINYNLINYEKELNTSLTEFDITLEVENNNE